MQMDRVVMWYGLCAVVGAASSWISGVFLSLAVIGALVLFGLILANVGDQVRTLPIHHAVVGLAVTLALSRVLPLALFAL